MERVRTECARFFITFKPVFSQTSGPTLNPNLPLNLCLTGVPPFFLPSHPHPLAVHSIARVWSRLPSRTPPCHITVRSTGPWRRPTTTAGRRRRRSSRVRPRRAKAEPDPSETSRGHSGSADFSTGWTRTTSTAASPARPRWSHPIPHILPSSTFCLIFFHMCLMWVCPWYMLPN
jgi:hypothetical protein